MIGPSSSGRLRRVVPWLFLAGACVGELLTVRVEQEGSTLIEGAGLVGTVLSSLELGGFDDLSVNIDQELQNQGVEPGDIASVYVVELRLSTPDGDDLSFLDTLDIYVSAPGLETARIAHLDAFPAGETTVQMELDGLDLTEFVVAESMTISTDATGTLPEDDTTIEVFMAIEVEATAQGACSQASKAAGEG
ncbi:MAG: hypothetical protein Q8P41_09910 [Pseudomonadota bacterium]|nr:hypothetical protein [Pseudomonadota bacterium]